MNIDMLYVRIMVLLKRYNYLTPEVVQIRNMISNTNGGIIMGDIRDIRERIADYIFTLPDGTSISIMEAFYHLYGSDEYRWVYKDCDVGRVYSADDGITYLVKDKDLWDVLKYVQDEADENEKIIDTSEWDSFSKGVPYLLRFVVRDKNDVIS